MQITIFFLYINIKVVELQNELKINNQKYLEIINDYEVLKNYIINKQQITDGVKLISENKVSILKV